MSELPFRVERTHPTALTVRIDNIRPGWQQYFLLRSDAHHDSTYCDQALEKKHLDEAVARGAGILDGGDLYDAMQAKYDKRQDQDQMRPELRAVDKQKYSDALVSYCSAFYEPYAANWILLAPGNHEEAFAQRHETSLTERLAERLKAKGSPVEVGGYQGWVRFLFTLRAATRKTVRLRYTHGYGGGGPVTKDVIQANRQLAYLGNADILWSGHVHESWHVTARQEVLDHNGKPVTVDVDCIKTPGYKDEYSCGKGWAAGKGLPPKPRGAYWIRFYVEGDDIRREIIRAG